MIRYLLQRRWLPWHFLWAVAVAGCVWLGLWQYQAAVAPQPLGADTQVWRNYAYALNWGVFAVVALWFWWRFIRDQRAAENAAAEQSTQPVASSEPASANSASGDQPPLSPDVRAQQQRFDPFASAEPHQGGSVHPSGGDD